MWKKSVRISFTKTTVFCLLCIFFQKPHIVLFFLIIFSCAILHRLYSSAYSVHFFFLLSLATYDTDHTWDLNSATRIGDWVAQWVKCWISAQVMILYFLSSSPHGALHRHCEFTLILCPSLSAPPPLSLENKQTLKHINSITRIELSTGPHTS